MIKWLSYERSLWNQAYAEGGLQFCIELQFSRIEERILRRVTKWRAFAHLGLAFFTAKPEVESALAHFQDPARRREIETLLGLHDNAGSVEVALRSIEVASILTPIDEDGPWNAVELKYDPINDHFQLLYRIPLFLRNTRGIPEADAWPGDDAYNQIMHRIDLGVATEEEKLVIARTSVQGLLRTMRR